MVHLKVLADVVVIGWKETDGMLNTGVRDVLVAGDGLNKQKRER